MHGAIASLWISMIAKRLVERALEEIVATRWSVHVGISRPMG